MIVGVNPRCAQAFASSSVISGCKTMNYLPSIDVTSARRVVSGDRYLPWLDALEAAAVSGVYAIIDQESRIVSYVGESHSARLGGTIKRHFRAWTGKNAYANGRRAGGKTYDRYDVIVAYVVTHSDDARIVQAAEIARLVPDDNEIDDVPSDVVVTRLAEAGEEPDIVLD